MQCEICLIQEVIKELPKVKEVQNLNYYCIQCKKVTEWHKSCPKTAQCSECNLKGTNKPKNCADCNGRSYLFFKNDKRLCKQCMSGFCPKNVTGVLPLHCFFCEDTLQTFYLYDTMNKMRCTGCEAVRPIEKPLCMEECPQCQVYHEGGLWTYNEMSWCEDCFRVQLEAYRLKRE